MEPLFTYDQIFYNDIIYSLEIKWGRKLTDHEKNVLIEGYRFGRMVESENEIRILSAN